LILEKVPLFLLSAASCVITMAAQKGGGSLHSLERLPVWVRGANALSSGMDYLLKTAWPAGLSVFYPYRPGKQEAFELIAAAALLLAVSVAVIRMAKRLPYLSAGWFWFLGTLVPVIGFIQVGDQAMADRYTYVPLTGLFIVAVWGISELSGRWPAARRAAAVAGMILLVALSAAGRVQAGYWRDSITLFSRSLDVTTENWFGNYNLAYAQLLKGDIDGSIRNLEAVVRLMPRHENAHFNLGVLLFRQGKVGEAIGHYNEVTRLMPAYPPAHYNLGDILERQGNEGAAAAHFREVVRLDPGYADARQRLDRLLSRSKR
jgi:tetratricopeptide (TPR) repeat protein